MLLDKNCSNLIWWNPATRSLSFINSVPFRSGLVRYFGRASFASFIRYLNKNGFRKSRAFAKGRSNFPDNQIRQFVLMHPDADSLMARASEAIERHALKKFTPPSLTTTVEAETRSRSPPTQPKNAVHAAGQQDTVLSLFGYSTTKLESPDEEYSFPLVISKDSHTTSDSYFATPEELLRFVERDFI